MTESNLYAVIMAGGKGERFWPESRVSHPKQLLPLIGNLTLIEQTVERLQSLVKPENIIIVTNKDYVAAMHSLMTFIPEENIIGEPVGRDTAPCIALVTAVISARCKDNPVMIVLPADHIIKDTESMLKVFKDGVNVASQGNIVTIGINPTFPSTGYGYIHCGNKCDTNTETPFYEGKGFKEKPNSEIAEQFVRSGEYKWNSGMFIWSVGVIKKAFRNLAPSLYTLYEKLCHAVRDNKLNETLEQLYPNIEKISIDYAIMEKVDNVVIAESSFDWDDVGSWTALRNQIRPDADDNVVRGIHVGLDTKNCIIVSDQQHLIATVDVEDLIIVRTSDATLVCRSRSAQRIKELVHKLASMPEMKKYL